MCRPDKMIRLNSFGVGSPRSIKMFLIETPAHDSYCKSDDERDQYPRVAHSGLRLRLMWM